MTTDNENPKIKIAQTDAFGGIQKGDELHLIDECWHLNGDPDEWFIQDETVQANPTLFKDKT